MTKCPRCGTLQHVYVFTCGCGEVLVRERVDETLAQNTERQEQIINSQKPYFAMNARKSFRMLTVILGLGFVCDAVIDVGLWVGDSGTLRRIAKAFLGTSVIFSALMKKQEEEKVLTSEQFKEFLAQLEFISSVNHACLRMIGRLSADQLEALEQKAKELSEVQRKLVFRHLLFKVVLKKVYLFIGVMLWLAAIVTGLLSFIL